MAAADGGDGGNRRNYFLALTMAVVIIVILVTEDLFTAVLIIGLLANFLIISSHLTDFGGGSSGSSGSSGGSGSSGDTDADGAEAAETRSASRRGRESSGPGENPGADLPHATYTPHAPVEEYPGAIDFGEDIIGIDGVGATAPALGHTDWTSAAIAGLPEGNPFPTGRITVPAAAPVCIDDEAIMELDGDEQNALQVRSRNDMTRVWAGTSQRFKLVDRYMGEELDEEENSPWWGRHEV